MTKIWRRLHFLSTVVAGLFILLASITGSILAVEPWFHSQNAVSGTYPSDLTYAAFQQKLQESFVELFSLEQDAYGNLKTEGVGLEKEGTLYVNAQTGTIVAPPAPLSPVFDLCRDFHRSLFLKTPGRILMGLASLALVFLTISGIGLHLKRAGGVKAIYASIKVLEIKRDGHALWSRLSWAPILLLAVSGAYLSAVRFAPTPAKHVVSAKVQPISLSQILLKEVKKVTYPMIDDEPLVIETTDKTLYYTKSTNQLIKVELLPVSEQLRATNFVLHTGEGTKIWTGILLLTTLVMIFLSGTGFQMVAEKWRQKKHSSALDATSDILILVGSETGHTWRFADALEQAFHQQGIRASSVGMEHFPVIKGKKTLLFLTSTYGDGDAPENAQRTFQQLETLLSDAEQVPFSVLGFGSKEYPAFCAFAQNLRNQLKQLPNTQEIVNYMTVNNQSVVEFIDWVRAFNKSQQLQLSIDTKQLKPVRKKGLATFTILEKKENNDTFLLRVAYPTKLAIQSGDLLGVYPPHENIERFYSIAVISPTELVLIIKRTGLCSNFLGTLGTGDTFEAYLKPNPSFYYPKTTQPVLMIANGTGIAPFLGMASPHNLLYWGGKTSVDVTLFSDYLPIHFYPIFSREKENGYVQELLNDHQEEVANLFKNNGIVMICGSLTMLNSVLRQLDSISSRFELPSVETLKQQGRILVDCY